MTTEECILMVGLCQLAMLMAILLRMRRLTGEVTKLVTVMVRVICQGQRSDVGLTESKMEVGR